ncbi:MAG: HAD hydrolase-like protein [Bacteroides sp.]|nr:HAD hydrolase-like protein [Bacteroides sp.]
MNDYKLAIFDLDGTILDTTEGIIASVKYTIKRFGFPTPNVDKLLSFIGPPIQESFALHYNIAGDQLQEMSNVFRDNYSSETLLQAKPYEGIYEVFEFLKDYKIQTAIATYKREDYALKLLKHFGFDKYTNIMFGADNENRLKKKDIILKCLHQTNLENSLNKCVMIGDTLHDANGAKSLNVDFIAVTYGFGFKVKQREESVVTKFYANTPKDIINYFKLNIV